jgi:signal transduction histidine kinase
MIMRVWPLARRSIRTRLTVLYGGALFAAGAALLGMNYILAVRSFGGEVAVSVTEAMSPRPSSTMFTLPKTPGVGAAGKGLTAGQLTRLSASLRSTTLHQLLASSAVALIVMLAIAVLSGWWMAGRTLQPLHRITAAARKLSSQNLHERIALDGPADELKDLADTFDDMLARLDRAFESQRRFIANASHELRTPLAIQRALIQIRLPEAAPEELVQVQADLLLANQRSEQLIDGLLMLARSDRGLTKKEPVHLSAVVADVVAQHRAAATVAGVHFYPDLHPVTVAGDPILLARLVSNLIHNAIRYNEPGGKVCVRVSAAGGLVVCNTGPRVPAATIPALFEPFSRHAGDPTGANGSTGLGLSIVRSIATAHHGTVTARPNEAGGLTVEVKFRGCGDPDSPLPRPTARVMVDPPSHTRR